MEPQERTIYLDLDGTLLDVRGRYWALHSHLVGRLGARSPLQRAYWGRKRRGLGLEAVLLDAGPAARREYRRRWLAEVETAAFLQHDRLLPGARDALARLGVRARLVLVTLRRNRRTLVAQLDHLGISGFFAQVATPQTPTEHESKAALIRRVDGLPGPGALVVGDTEADVAAARELGLRSVAVLSGLRDRAFLEARRPDYIIQSITELPRLLEGLGPDAPRAGGAGSLTVLT
ncbi:MAG TPA: HAD hydrolase-like protein [Dehalococcoidia bacterium]